MEEWIFTKAVVNVSWERGEVLQVVLLWGAEGGGANDLPGGTRRQDETMWMKQRIWMGARMTNMNKGGGYRLLFEIRQ